MNKNNVLQHLLLGAFLMIFSTASVAQNTILRANGAMNDGDSHWNNDTDTVKTENVPIGLYVWKINPLWRHHKSRTRHTPPPVSKRSFHWWHNRPL